MHVVAKSGLNWIYVHNLVLFIIQLQVNKQARVVVDITCGMQTSGSVEKTQVLPEKLSQAKLFSICT